MTVLGIIGKKIGTTQVFRDDGRADCVTAVEAGPCTVVQVKTLEKDGYESAQLGFERARRLNKPRGGHLQKSGNLLRNLKEVAVEDASHVQVGQTVDVSLFQPGDRVDAMGWSKGRGFAGGVKRHHFRGGPKTHGQSDRHRAPGSIGAGTDPGRVIKGTKMAGQMGNKRVTVRNLEVVQVDPERSLLLVKGSIPGARNSLVVIQKADRGKGGAGEA